MPEHSPRDRHRQGARPSTELVLSALERAARHGPPDAPGASSRAVLEHLDLRERSPGGREARRLLKELLRSGQLAHARRHGRDVWALTNSGRERLRRAVLSGLSGPLPESPQHRAWRQAQDAGALQIPRLRRELGEILEEASRLLGADPPAHSDAWFDLAERLRVAARRVGSAGHCLYEWSEPDDGHADRDELLEPADGLLDGAALPRRRALRTGRRNVLLWGPDP